MGNLTYSITKLYNQQNPPFLTGFVISKEPKLIKAKLKTSRGLHRSSDNQHPTPLILQEIPQYIIQNSAMLVVSNLNF
ncbi:hypothetical protein SAMN06265367_106146 [Algoriphagus winogradskyi]|uniref:Uncharacterized protein n=1 Tax=Algoriphagus winogradskyi TaxID=237017 RepID=A0ABY1PB50_9BACT|nr:hypothetical protein SAMN06265367_106146 [Algoriphagus winogradskyi]